MAVEKFSVDRPQENWTGLSARRERIWGVAGGVLGSMAGAGSFLIAKYVQKEPWSQLYPGFLQRRELVPLDFYFLGLLVSGFCFLSFALFLIRRSRYPRTDGYGAALVGTIFISLGAAILFLRFWTLLHL